MSLVELSSADVFALVAALGDQPRGHRVSDAGLGAMGAAPRPSGWTQVTNGGLQVAVVGQRDIAEGWAEAWLHEGRYLVCSTPEQVRGLRFVGYVTVHGLWKTCVQESTSAAAPVLKARARRCKSTGYRKDQQAHARAT